VIIILGHIGQHMTNVLKQIKDSLSENQDQTQ